jgi:hypothetical protein
MVKKALLAVLPAVPAAGTVFALPEFKIGAGGGLFGKVGTRDGTVPVPGGDKTFLEEIS